MKKKVLFVGAHCDDLELACGATIHRYQDRWDMTAVILVSIGPAGDLAEVSKRSLARLGIHRSEFHDLPDREVGQHRQKVWEILHLAEERYAPDLAFTHWPDINQDHEAVFKESERNFRCCSLISYTQTRSTISYQPNLFIPVSREDVDAKIGALSEYQIYEEKNYFYPDNILAKLRFGGIFIEQEFAETFRVERQIGLG
jgi:LmbE family N-acetylglucosaminyl deacetylase